jgi:hypothetical protein
MAIRLGAEPQIRLLTLWRALLPGSSGGAADAAAASLMSVLPTKGTNSMWLAGIRSATLRG